MSAKPATAAAPQPEAAEPAFAVDENMMMLGGGALALLALGGGAIALTRRRRRRREEAEWEAQANQPETQDPLFDEPMFQNEPASAEHQPPIVAPAPSAFAWDDVPRHDPVGKDCEEGKTWVERAKCGPTEDNPSASLRTRLKRAAFFDKREREVEAGMAEPLDADAGLPEAMVEGQAAETERERA